MRSFVYSSHPSRVLFGAGTVRQLPYEVDRLGGSRVLVLGRGDTGEAVWKRLGALGVAQFPDAAMHTPVEVTERALAMLAEYGIDCLVSVGGGTSTGLGKAIAIRTGLPHLAVPTTYAGSEVTPVLGETIGGEKTTRTAPGILPETVVYDVELTLGLPVPVSVASGVNAMAHAVEALYSPDANPVIDGFALQAIAAMAGALPRIAEDPSDVDAREEALRAGWLAGTCLAGVGMGLHHKLCHVLGGTFNLPHAQTHTAILPHAMAYNAPAAPDAMRSIAEALGTGDAPTGVYDLIAALDGPTSLGALGMPEAELPRAALLALTSATRSPYPNPREITLSGVEGLLRDAWSGRRPERPADAGPDLGRLTRQVVDSFAGSPNPRVGALLADLVRHLHDFVRSNDVTEEEWLYAIDFLTRTGQISSPKRQEFVLLSDTLGVSSVVDALTNSRTPQTTPSAVLGPFYVSGPPKAEPGADISAGLPGTPLWVDVRVEDPSGKPVAGAVVDVWQSNEDGFYDVQLPELTGPALRARFEADAEGRIRFWSILPSEYPIPGDGPVGQLLDAVGRHPYRAPHLHFMIMAYGYRRLVTQLFVSGGAYLDSDTVFGVKDDLIVDFAPGRGPAPAGREVDGPWHRLEYTFRIAPA
ncbi:maleylacetate reductase and hydroxyquinol 1,2-dioxygenase domain-containing protein [Rugosimonospora africana]|uniref:Alcohol dehydrogenase n=1 Tax=Rugosimonospora africana TaxID=556532 RepID=A0A8J3VSS5_9ACTN|nr:maleylacetate reductase and hydroxyquinol 1,2-dioxygenase domain-containing protein [Rugosimonospora africana]GIH16931.1 alcohol dehydrogenase [Rugosimonospora africana]